MTDLVPPSAQPARSPEERRRIAYLRLGAFSAHLARGDTRAALEAARDACLAAPEMAEAHYAYGQAWIAAKNPARAEQAFVEALRRRPNFPDAWVNYGLARYARGAVADARRAMHEALRLRPGHAAATANLAVLLRLTGLYEVAESLLVEALARDPGDAASRLNLVAERLLEERCAEALALLSEVPAPANDIAAARHWLLQRTTALIGLGRVREARRALSDFDALGTPPPEVVPLRIWRIALILEAEGDRAGARDAAAKMEAALAGMGPTAVLEHRIMARFELARFWSRQGEPAKAFDQWREGHALLRPVQPFSREAENAHALATQTAFTTQRFALGPRASNTDEAPVFIVGMPRSGTTLCEQILDAHADAHGAGERAALGALAWRLGGGETPDAIARIAALDRDTLDAAANEYLRELHALAPDKRRIVDKMPGNYRYVWLIALLFPKARIIHCVRDPRDIGLSIFTFRFHGEHGYAHDLGDLGWAISQQLKSMQHWKQALPGLILTLPLADWVTDFDATLARVLAHLDLPPDPNCHRFYESDSRVRTVSRSQVRQPVNARGIGRWKPYAEALAPLIDELERGGALDGLARRDEMIDASSPSPTPDCRTRLRTGSG